MRAIVLKKTGDAGNLKVTKVDDPVLKKGEIIVRNKVIGINFFDVAFRRGQYALKEMPAILGMEACGVVEKVASDVKRFKVGERVAYATGGIGAYAEKKAVHQNLLVPVPDEITDAQAAASLYKGLMVHALLYRVFIAKKGKRILVHAAAGGVGHILTQWAKHIGLQIIGTVGSDEKIDFAKKSGCNHVINYNSSDFFAEVAKVTKNSGVGVVYDSVGKATLEKSMQCLWPMGMCVSFGESSGKTDALDLNQMVGNSLYLTRPTMALYKANPIELSLSAAEVFAAIEQEIIKPKITEYDFKDVVKAHKDLESRQTTGSLVLRVD